MRFVNKHEPVILTEAEGKALLGLARGAIESALASAPPPEIPPDAPKLSGPVFVTLRESGELRGCMGTLQADLPLAQAVIECAEAAALRDPRFQPVTADELPDLEIEISVLHSFRSVGGPEDISIGRDGLVISKGPARGLLLPQVAVEFQVNPEQFLDMVCRKAGLPDGAWRDADLLAFQVQVFAEPGKL